MIRKVKEGCTVSGILTTVPIESLRPSGLNVRKVFDDQAMAELTESVRQVGILQPLLVAPDPEGGDGKYIIVAGERRYRAALAAGLKEVPVALRSLAEDEIREAILVENLQRRDLDPIEEAQGIRQLLATGRYTQERLAERLGLSQSHIANRLRLLRLPKAVRESISRKIISASHALALVKLCPDGQEPSPLIEKALQAVSRVPAKEAYEAVDSFIWSHGKALKPATSEDRENAVRYGWALYNPLFDLGDCQECAYAVEARPSHSERTERFCVGVACWDAKQKRAQAELRKNAKHPATEEDRSYEERQRARVARAEELAKKVEERLTRAHKSGPGTQAISPAEAAAAERLRGLAEPVWREWRSFYSDEKELFDAEFYLDLGTLLRHFERRKELGASKLCHQFGAGKLVIPRQGIEIALVATWEKEVIVTLNPLRISFGYATITDTAPTGKVYYRARLVDSGSAKSLRQAAVIPCAARDIILMCESTVMIRREIVPRWADLLAELPALPRQAAA